MASSPGDFKSLGLSTYVDLNSTGSPAAFEPPHSSSLNSICGSGQQSPTPPLPSYLPPKASQVLGASGQQEGSRSKSSSEPHDKELLIPEKSPYRLSRTTASSRSTVKEPTTPAQYDLTETSARSSGQSLIFEIPPPRPEHRPLQDSQTRLLPRNEGKLASVLGSATDRGGSRSRGALATPRILNHNAAIAEDLDDATHVSTGIGIGTRHFGPPNPPKYRIEKPPTRKVLCNTMPKSAPPPLPLGSKTETKSQRPSSPSARSPLTPHSPRSPPASPGQNSNSRAAMGPKTVKQETNPPRKASRPAEAEDTTSEQPPRSPITAIPQYPPSPTVSSPKHGRDQSKSIFSNLKASRSTNRLNGPESWMKVSSKPDLTSRASSKDRSVYSSSRGHDSTPELQNFNSTDRNYDDTGRMEEPLEGGQGTGGESQTGTEDEPSVPMSNKKGKGKFGLLSRSRSIKLDDGAKSLKPIAKHKNVGGSDSEDHSHSDYNEPIKTAPLQPERDRSFWGSANRNRSADRQLQQQPVDTVTRNRKEKIQVPPTNLSSSANSPWSVSAAFKQAGSKAADGLGKTGKGLLNKMVRSGSSTEKEMLVEVPHVCQVINLPLIEQTRRTRISKKLEDSRDKTEFWMPALPWRCIDFLNANGCEEEGLYRVPGSGKEVKLFQKRFDTEFDVNLFDQPQLYDINTIGSLFKLWLRELPDEILPKETQARIQEQCSGQTTTTPQIMKDELSRLPPFNYYLLFAITCHLSLLLSYKDVNRMDYRNLCICFQPCMKIDHFCFTFLVCDWKNCWQGCWTEKPYLEEENKYIEELKSGIKPSRLPIKALSNGASDDRVISSSESNKPVALETTPPPPVRVTPPPASADTTNDKSGEECPQPSNGKPHRRDSQRLSLGLPPLSPIRVE